MRFDALWPGAPSLRFLQGREAILLVRLLDRSVMLTFPPPPFARGAKDGALCFLIVQADQKQSLSQPRDYFPFAVVLKYKVGVVPSVFRNMEMNALGVL